MNNPKKSKPIPFSAARIRLPCHKCNNVSKTNPPIDIQHTLPETFIATGTCAVCKEQKKQILNRNQYKKLPPCIINSTVGTGFKFQNVTELDSYPLLHKIFAGTLIDSAQRHHEHQKYNYNQLGIKCEFCDSTTQTNPPYNLFILEGGKIKLSGMCDCCDDIKSTFLSKEQKSCLPKYVQNAKPFSKFKDYVETPNGGFLPLITLIPLILKGVAVAALSTSAISGVADTIINAVRGKGLTHTN